MTDSGPFDDATIELPTHPRVADSRPVAPMPRPLLVDRTLALGLIICLTVVILALIVGLVWLGLD